MIKREVNVNSHWEQFARLWLVRISIVEIILEHFYSDIKTSDTNEAARPSRPNGFITFWIQWELLRIISDCDAIIQIPLWWL